MGPGSQIWSRRWKCGKEWELAVPAIGRNSVSSKRWSLMPPLLPDIIQDTIWEWDTISNILASPPLTNSTKTKILRKNLKEKKWWSKYVVGQNWKSVSSWNLSVSLHICPSLSLKFVSPWSQVGSCRLPKKRISSQIHVNHDWHQPCEPSNKDSLKIWDC